MRLLSSFEQARLNWYFRWSDGDLSLLASGFQSVLAAEMNEKMKAPEASASFNDYMKVHPTRQRAVDFLAQQERAMDRVEDERVVRSALSMLTKPEQEELLWVFVIPLLPTRRGFGPYGNLAEYTEMALEYYRAKKRKQPIQMYLDKLSKRAKWKSASTWERQYATMIMLQCEARAVIISRKYTLALEGLNADSSAA